MLELDSNNVHAYCDRAETFIANEQYEEGIVSLCALSDVPLRITFLASNCVTTTDISSPLLCFVYLFMVVPDIMISYCLCLQPLKIIAQQKALIATISESRMV